MKPALNQITTFVLPRANEAQLKQAAGCLGLTDVKVLSPGVACEGYSNLTDSQSANEVLESEGILADICVQPEEGRRKSVLVCDMDSTLIGQECIDELADFAGVKDKVSEITERAMRGEIDFDGALRERVSLLEGLPASVIDDCYKEKITINDGARALVRTMSAHGAKTLIVSGGFTAFTKRIAEACGFDDHQANTLIIADDHLTGEVGEPILGRDAKRTALMDFTGETPSDAVAIGDGANDLAMIEVAGLGLAYHAKPAVAEAAHSAISHTTLRTALYFQGYSDDDIESDTP